MKLIAVVVTGLLLAVVSEAQEALPQWAGRAEFEMADVALKENDLGRMIDGLLAWESAYPNSELAPQRTQTLIYAYRRLGLTASGQIPLLYKIVSLGPMLKKRSVEETKAIQAAANTLLEELAKPSIVAPADAKELAIRALAIEGQ